MRRIFSFLLSVIMLAVLAGSVSAQGTTNLVLRMVDDDVPVVGAQFEIYRIGEQTEAGNPVLTGKFADYPVQLAGSGEDTSPAANALYGFVKKDSVTPDAVVTTDSNGSATVKDLASGIYLVAGLPLQYNDTHYETEPQILVLPWVDEITGETLTDPVLNVKFSKETASTVNWKVLKIWDDHSGYARPKSVKVHLLKDGQVHDTVLLTADNQWRHTWEGLDANALWQIVEEVPAPYTVTVEREGSTFLLTNSVPEQTPPGPDPTEPQPSEPDSTEPQPTEPKPTDPPKSEDKIPQTGMLWWPVVLLAALGTVCIVCGVALRKEHRE